MSGLLSYEIRRCKIGTVVRTMSIITDKYLYGHIIGFERNIHDELTLKVRWEGGEESPIHAGNVDILD